MKNDNLEFLKLLIEVLALQALVAIVGLLSIVTGKLAVFTNARVGGNKVSMHDVREILMGWGGVIETSDGPVVFCHGCPNGSMVLSEEELAEKVGPGTYWLVSCYNGNRMSFEHDGRTFFRVPETCLPLRSYVTGFRGILIVGSTNLLDKICTISHHKAEKLKDLVDGN